MNHPLQRKKALIVEEVAGETVVYDETSHRAHCLNATAAKVWRLCDGRTSIDEITTAISAGMVSPVDSGVVRLAVCELGELGLLDGDPAAFLAAGSRREAIQKMVAAGGAIALLPAITSIVAPTPAMAQSADYHAGSGSGLSGGGSGIGYGGSGGGNSSGGGGNSGGGNSGRGRGNGGGELENPGRGHGRGGGNSGEGRGNR